MGDCVLPLVFLVKGATFWANMKVKAFPVVLTLALCICACRSQRRPSGDSSPPIGPAVDSSRYDSNLALARSGQYEFPVQNNNLEEWWFEFELCKIAERTAEEGNRDALDEQLQKAHAIIRKWRSQADAIIQRDFGQHSQEYHERYFDASSFGDDCAKADKRVAFAAELYDAITAHKARRKAQKEAISTLGLTIDCGQQAQVSLVDAFQDSNHPVLLLQIKNVDDKRLLYPSTIEIVEYKDADGVERSGSVLRGFHCADDLGNDLGISGFGGHSEKIYKGNKVIQPGSSMWMTVNLKHLPPAVATEIVLTIDPATFGNAVSSKLVVPAEFVRLKKDLLFSAVGIYGD